MRNVVIRHGCHGAALRALSIAIVISCAGCGSGSASPEGEHGKHIDPPHKPVTFAEAVQQLEPRLEELAGPLASDVRAKRLVELDDILRWLPQLAGDTDLRRADWDEVNGTTARLVALRQGQQAEALFPSALVQQARPLTSRLAELAAKTTPAQGAPNNTPDSH